MLLANEVDKWTGSRRGVASRRARDTARYYARNAEAYAGIVSGIDTSARLARFAAMLPPGASVLDAGCGAGRDLVQFRKAGFRVVGLDLSPALATIARRTSGCEVVVGDLSAPPAALGTFDGIWAMASLLHLGPDEVERALAALTGCLRPGGILFSSVKRGVGEVVDDLGRWFTLHDEGGWAALLRGAGLEVLEIEGEPPADGTAAGSVAPGWISSLARRP